MKQVKTPARKPWIGYSVYGGVVLLFSLNGAVSKSIMHTGISAERLAQLRSTSAFLVLALLTAIIKPSAFKISRREFGLLAAFGILGVTMSNYLYFVGISRLPIGISLILEFTAPIWVALWMRFIQKRDVRKELWLGIGLAFIGMVLVAQVWQGLTLDAIGVIASFGAAAAMTVYYLLGERVAPQRDPLSLTMWTFAMSTVFWSVAQPWASFPWQALGKTAEIATRDGLIHVPVLGLTAYMVLLGTVVTFGGINIAFRHLTAGQAGLFGMLEPPVASLIAWATLGENLLAIQIGGGLLILGGIATAELSRLRGRASAETANHPPQDLGHVD